MRTPMRIYEILEAVERSERAVERHLRARRARGWRKAKPADFEYVLGEINKHRGDDGAACSECDDEEHQIIHWPEESAIEFRTLCRDYKVTLAKARWSTLLIEPGDVVAFEARR
jgi:hypothetical protein